MDNKHTLRVLKILEEERKRDEEFLEKEKVKMIKQIKKDLPKFKEKIIEKEKKKKVSVFKKLLIVLGYGKKR